MQSKKKEPEKKEKEKDFEEEKESKSEGEENISFFKKLDFAVKRLKQYISTDRYKLDDLSTLINYWNDGIKIEISPLGLPHHDDSKVSEIAEP